MASKKQDTTPKIVVTEEVFLALAVDPERSHAYGTAYHQTDFTVLEEFVEHVNDHFGFETARSLVDLNIGSRGITATIRTEK